MSATPARFARKVWPLLACTLLGMAGCGQRGPLYMPDRNARVVTRPAANTADSSAATSAPSSAPR